MGKAVQKRKKYSAKFKIKVIMDMRKHHLNRHETVRKYWKISKNKEKSYTKQVRNWKRIYLEEGVYGFMKEKRPKACGFSKTKESEPPDLEKKTMANLIAEIQQLRMENDFLKKLKALVLAEEKKSGKRHK